MKSVHDSLGSAQAEPERKPSGSDEASNEQSSNLGKNASGRKDSDKQEKAMEVPKGLKDTERFTVVSKWKAATAIHEPHKWPLFSGVYLHLCRRRFSIYSN